MMRNESTEGPHSPRCPVRRGPKSASSFALSPAWASYPLLPVRSLPLVVVPCSATASMLSLGLAGVAAGMAGGWWVITERSYRRIIGMGWRSPPVSPSSPWALLRARARRIGLRLYGSSGALLLRPVDRRAQASLAHPVATSATSRQLPPDSRTSHPVLLCNPWSGGGKVERFELGRVSRRPWESRRWCSTHGLDLGELARDAIARGADCLGMAGGDGSQALVASLAVQHDLPFVCVSAGTRNHFALDLGLPSRRPEEECMPAFRDGIERRVDYATVNDRFFVNNVSLGVYATIVQQPGYREAKVGHDQEANPGAARDQDEPFDLQFITPDGREVDGAFVVMVSNNPYFLGVLARRVAAQTSRHRPAGCLRGHRDDRKPGGCGGHAGSGRARGDERPGSPVRVRRVRGAVTVGYGLRGNRRRGTRARDATEVPYPSRRPAHARAGRQHRCSAAPRSPRRPRDDVLHLALGRND